jgi:hypothetical protein
VEEDVHFQHLVGHGSAGSSAGLRRRDDNVADGPGVAGVAVEVRAELEALYRARDGIGYVNPGPRHVPIPMLL